MPPARALPAVRKQTPSAHRVLPRGCGRIVGASEKGRLERLPARRCPRSLEFKWRAGLAACGNGSSARKIHALKARSSPTGHSVIDLNAPMPNCEPRAARRGQANQNSTSDAGMKRRPRSSAASGAKSIPPGCYHRAEPAGCCTVDLWTKDSLSGTSVRLPEPSCTQRHRSPT
jgi:hypothetical protein